MSVAPESGRNRIMIYGPTNDGTYIVEFTTAAGGALAISVPARRACSSISKRGVNVCQQQLVNELLGPLVTEFVRNFSRQDATPIQRNSQAVKFIRHNTSRIFRAAHIDRG